MPLVLLFDVYPMVFDPGGKHEPMNTNKHVVIENIVNMRQIIFKRVRMVETEVTITSIE